MAASASKVKAPLAVALLGRADHAREILRQALQDLGAEVVFEGDPATLQSEEVLRRRPQVVIVNLASGVEDDIDHLQPLFDSDAVNVVFNEADVSSQLAGWDLARWARHLAAKVMGHERTIPPPPPGAELLPLRNFMPVPGAPPTPAQLAGDRAIEEFMIEAEDLVDAVPSNHLPLAQRSRVPAPQQPAEPEPDFGIDLDRVEDALAQADMPAAVRPASVPQPRKDELAATPAPAPAPDPSPGAAFDFDALDAAFDLGPPRPKTVPRETAVPAGRRDDAVPLAVPTSPSTAPETPPEAVIDDDALLDLSALEAALEQDTTARPTSSGRSDAEILNEALSGLDLDFIDDTADQPASGSDASIEISSTPDSGAIDGEDYVVSTNTLPSGESDDYDYSDFDSSSDVRGAETGIEAIELSSGDIDVDSTVAMDDDVAALSAQLDALDAGTPRGEAVVDLTFIDFSDAPATPPTSAAAVPSAPKAVAATTRNDAVDAAPAAPKIDFGALALAPMDDDAAHPPSAAPASPRSYDFSGLEGLSLEPTSEELETEVQQATVKSPVANMDSLLAAMDLAPPVAAAAAAAPDTDSGTIRRVIVLGASIGGPDALRTFLGGIPEGFPALFVLVQHLENGFFERLAQQLQKASRLPVRVPDGHQRARVGEVLVVSAAQRLQVGPDGEISLLPHAEPPRYSPCIDTVMRDIADRFGASATAIIFSGMAGDAIEGAVYLTTLGGEVWAQDPASCVVSSMVDGARARGVVEYLGSPRELAEHCVARYGAG